MKKRMVPPWAPSSGQQNSHGILNSRSFLVLRRKEKKENQLWLNRDSSLKDPQEPRDPKGWLAPQALLGPQDSLETVVYRALLASQASLALMGSRDSQAL